MRTAPTLPLLVVVALAVARLPASLVLSAEEEAAAAESSQHIRKPLMADTIRATVYADNAFTLYVNGDLVAVDSIAFLPHNVIEVDILPAYPMTIAVMAKDNADPTTGMEYANTSIGDGGFILMFGDGTVTDGTWKARCFSHGPVKGDTRNPRVETMPIPDDWYSPGFDDAAWDRASEYADTDVDPKQPFFDADFSGARFIWTDDLKLDNTVIFRKTVAAPPDGKLRPDFRGLNDVVPEGLPKGGGRRPRPGPLPSDRGPARGTAR